MKPTLLISVVLVLLICTLALNQGGFFFLPVAIAGVVCVFLSVVCAFIYRQQKSYLLSNRENWILPIGFLAIAILNLLSATFNGWTNESVGPVLCWIALCAFALASVFSTAFDKSYVMNGFCWFVFAISIVACIAVMGFMPEDSGIMAAGRLCILFEYSNATGIWFGMAALIASGSSNHRIRELNCLPLYSMLLTKSVGSITVIVCATIVAMIIFAKIDNRKLFALALSWTIAFLAFILNLVYPLAGTAFLLSASAIIFALAEIGKRTSDFPCLFSHKSDREKAKSMDYDSSTSKSKSAFRNKRISIAIICGFICFTCCAIAAIFVLEPSRLVEACGTFDERLVQIEDGIKLLSTNVFLGIGPEQWGNTYQSIQTIEYTATVNHCSYLQMALDGGILAPLIYLSTMVYAIICCWKKGKWTWSLAAIALLMHSIFDFDLHFYALQCLAVFLISPNSNINQDISE